MSIYDKSSLVLIPSGTKTGKVYSQKPVSGDGDFTFTRSSAATRVNADGFIEKETQNILLQSNSYNTTWSGFNGASGQAGYDGSNNAWRYDSSSSVLRLQQVGITFSGVHTFSFYAKYVDAQWFALQITGTTNENAWFDIQNGTLGSTSSAVDSSITSVGGGWYRCSVTGSASNQNRVRLYVVGSDGSLSTITASLLIQDAQLEQGLVARDYIETTTTAVEGGITDNVPRLDYTDSSCPALLLEPQRTNLVPHSEYLDSWGATNIFVTSNNITSPEGIINASKLERNATGAYISQNVSLSGDQTYSVFLKKGDLNFGRILGLGTGNPNVYFDLENGSVETETNATGSIEDFGDGWYRCSIVFNTTTTAVRVYPTENDASTGGANGYIYAYGTQLEAGSYATSYIPTYGSSVTRNADSCSKTGVSSLIGQTEGTMFAEINFVDNNTDSMFMTIGDGTSTNRIHIGYDKTSDWIYCNVKAAGLQQALITSSSPSDGIKKIAVAYKQNDYVVYINGVSVGADTNANVPTLTRIDIGGYFSAGFEYPVKQNLLFKTRLTNAELAALTTI